MSLYFEEESDIRLSIDCEKTAREVIDAALDYENFPYEAEVEILLTDNEAIQELNREYRDIDRPTDVLSFPMISYDKAGDFSILESEEDCFNPETGEAVLGNIVISKEKVLAQAQEYGHSVLREYAFLIAHSMLHLMGYDHMEEEERLVMEAKQKEILEKLGISR
ncbi:MULTISPECIES: rRNA maturation RNase YbeY [Sellimonas]|uniref:Endoribonuclease YbeY n=1 Tax=Sellimonas caecigallum TaxID=2592333 RepID=A0ABS7LA20_9FIRM|nr:MULTISPECIES: rRNA maturation RNase YbeY [Sellimonas]MBY0759587.1 rRNA maturation RNase YbeY [Sellimonas caecigallum]OUP02128.1 rRNA maturation RNase YbeY [Drancourtella sp. An210]OUP62881.1 rRNA maturation RNase YbeY [Drancourtella sp. An177]